MNTLFVRMKPYIQPFERILALRELEVIADAKPRALGLLDETSIDFEIKSTCTQNDLVKRLAYWEAVKQEKHLIITDQSLRESTVSLVRNEIATKNLYQQLSFQQNVALPNRRCLRYGTHGLHEYRGKFFPQLVRSLINISNITNGGIVADPMNGSGTTVVEAILAGCHGFGLDINPLSVFIGNTKAKLLSADPANLISCYEQIHHDLRTTVLVNKRRLAYFESLPVVDQNYLSSWFSEKVLVELDKIICAIQRLTNQHAQDLMRISLSNILRSVSWQKDDDLRVRKEVRPDIDIDPRKQFLEELDRSIRSVLSFLFKSGVVQRSQFNIIQGDARQCSTVWGDKSVDVVITSPPYATALPYLDTDRLSLCYLGLLSRADHKIKDREMIGNREVSESLRRYYWDRFKMDGEWLPNSVQELIQKIEFLNSKFNVGFRRRNLPALLSNYFFDMRDVLIGIYNALKPGCLAFIVVGNNHTIAGGQRVEIQTAMFLKEIADSVGLDVMDTLSMDMLMSRDIFRKNAMSSEEILILRRPF